MLDLSSLETDQITDAIETLISPLEYQSVDEWRLAVNRQLKEVLRADSAGFLLPTANGPLLLSEEHDPAELAKYPDYPPPPLVDGTPLWGKLIDVRVSTLSQIYGRDYDLYLDSPYYQEYAGANGAHDTLAMATSLGGSDAYSTSILHFWHASPTGTLFGEREIQILRLLYPAFRAGIDAQIRWGAYRPELFGTLDRLGQAVIVYDHGGQLLHRTSAVEDLLQRDPQRDLVVAEARRLALQRGMAGCVHVKTELARYELRASQYSEDRASGPMTLVAVERRTPMLLAESELRAQFGLTRAEVPVAHLIGKGLSNNEIAQALQISPHTARRHTERILMKLGVRSRAEVLAKLLS